MMACPIIFSHEKRPLKRPRLGPPDVYPQDPRQREDELTAVNVKQGFSHIPQLSDEFGTAKNCNISAAKLGAFMNGALSKKGEANTFPDTGKRRLQVNTKDHFWHVTHTPRHKQVLEAWMRDLAGAKPLSAIAKKVPIFNKREEIFLTLAENQVPMIRAAWFLKMTASYNSAISEAKTKKRQMPDPSQEWTISLARCCKDILLRLSDWYNGGTGAIHVSPSIGSNNPAGPLTTSSGVNSTLNNMAGHTSVNGPTSASNSTGGNSVLGATLSEDGSISLRQWLYCMDLAKYLYEEGLLDRYEWLIWLIDMCDKTKSVDDPAWKALVPVMLSYLPDIAQSELLARRLSTLAARKLSAIFVDQDFAAYSPSGGAAIPPPSGLLERLQCTTHKNTVLGLCSAIQVVLLECPTAMVYNGNPMAPQSESGRNTVPGGSPLDILPIQPSVFPMPQRAHNSYIRNQLRAAESHVIARSRAVEAKWSCDEWQQSSAGSTLQKVLSALEYLDRHFFDRVESTNSLETLYSQIFSSLPTKETPAEADAPVVLLLCQWAVGPQRTGEHRALAVARLLEHRQSELLSASCNTNASDGTLVNGTSNSENGNQVVVKVEKDNSINNTEAEVPMDTDLPSNNGSNSGTACEMNGLGSSNGNVEGEEGEFPNGLPIYHNLLVKFLDTDAPLIDDSAPGCRTAFTSLVNLFSALIRHDVFSHDAYLCTLVARGDLSAAPPASSTAIVPPSSVQPIPSVATPGPASQAGPTTPASVSSITPSTTPRHDAMDDRGPLFPPLPRMTDIPRQPDFVDDPNIDDDLDRLLQHITQEQQNMDQVDSPRDDSGTSGGGGFGSITPNPHQQAPLSNSTNSSDPTSNTGGKGNAGAGSGSSPSNNNKISKQSRHRQYVTHFQLPQDDNYQHEANQRHILLYGVGRARDEARHGVKKVSKDLGKLFSKKFCYDIADGSRVKRHSKSEFNFEQLQGKFVTLPFYDQHAVTSTIAQSAVEMLASFASGRSSYLPTVEHIGYLTDLMELGLNVTGLLETCVGMLRELPEIDTILTQRGSAIAGVFPTSLLLQLISILRKYHCCLLLDTELTMIGWESLVRLMRRISSTFECSSAERCALAYITDLQNCCSFLRTKSLTEYLSPTAAKLRQSLSNPVAPSMTAHSWNNSFMTQCLDNPERKVDISTLRQLQENAGCRYSFVCNAILSICNEADAERINDLASLCAEMTAAVPSLAPEWLSVLRTLCNPSRHCVSYADLLSEVDVKHLSIHSSLATLTSLLVARQCFSLQDFVLQAVPALLKAWNEGRGPSDTDTEAGARLACQLLLSLFKTLDDINCTTASPGTLKLSCDRRLLSATHSSISLGAVLAVLKAMLLLADAASACERRKEQRSLPSGLGGELSISHILGTSDAPASDRNNDALRGESRTLASFAYSALQQMCSESWVRLQSLQNLDELCAPDMLIDPCVSHKQAQRLLHLICYPEMPLPDEGLDPKVHIPRLMESLDQWNLREAWLALTLQSKQLANSPVPIEHGNWLDIVARSALEVFHLGTEDGLECALPNSAAPSPAPGKSPRSGKKGGQQQSQEMIARTPPSSFASSSSGSSGGGIGGLSNGPMSAGGTQDKSKLDDDGSQGSKINGADLNIYGWTASAAWLLAPLVAKLSPAVQGRVLRHAGNVLEAKHFFKKRSDSSGSENIDGQNGGTLQALLPFLALILTCLKGQDEQREGLLASLLNQFTQLLTLSKSPDVEIQSESVRDVLRLRLSLVGGMFDAIQRSSTATADWAVVLTQLVTNGIVDLHTNNDIFPTIIDMITALVHSTQIAEPGDRIEEMKKQNMNLIKKLKKEIADKDTESIKPLRQLLPFSKVQEEIIVTQATSMIVDSKGNRVQSFEFVDKKPGLAVWEKQKVSPWEIIEGQKNPAQISWGWFGAVKMERKPLRYEEAYRLLRFHTHNIVKSNSHFLEPVPLPPEDIDVKPEINIKEEIILKPDTPLSDQSPRGAIVPPGRKPKAPRKRRQTKAQQAAAAAQPPQINSPSQPPPTIPTVGPAVRTGSPFGNPVGAPHQMPVPGPNPPPPSYPPAGPTNPQWFNGNPQQQQQQPPQAQPPPPQQPQQAFYGQGPPQGPAGRPPLNQSKQVLHNMLRARTGGPPTGPNQFQQFPQGPPQGGPGGPRPNILRQQLRGQAPLTNQNFQNQPGMQPNQGPMMYQQQPMPQQPGMNPNYGYNQPGMNPQGPPGSGGPAGSNMIPQQPQMNSQMMNQRGPMPPNSDMSNFMQGGGPQGPQGQIRPQMGQRPPGFMQGNPQQGNPGMNSMQGVYTRPQMGQMGQQNQIGQPGQMNQQNQMSQQGQMVQQPGQMGMLNPGQMNQMGQMGMQNPGQMSQGMGMPNQGMVQPGQMGQPNMGNPGQGMQGQMGQSVMQGGGQMGQPGMQNPMGPGAQRMRLAAMQQQQQQQQQQPGMGMGPGPRMQYQNQPGGY